MIKNNKKIAIFFNSLRGLNVLKFLNKKFNVDVYLCKKNLNISLKNKLKNNNYNLLSKINYKFINKIKRKKYFLLISAGCPYIFPKDLINSSENGTINLHAGRLPQYKGGSPLNWQIINGEKTVGISVIKMTTSLDAGPIYEKFNFKIGKNDDIKYVHNIANNMFPTMTLNAISKISKKIKPNKQSFNRSKVYKQRSDKDGLIIWNKLNSKEVYNFVRAITKPYPGAYYYKLNKKVRLFKCKEVKLNPNLIPGTQFKIKNKKFIRCKNGSVQI